MSVGIGATAAVLVFGIGVVTMPRLARTRALAVAFAINLFKRGIVKGEPSPLMMWKCQIKYSRDSPILSSKLS